MPIHTHREEKNHQIQSTIRTDGKNNTHRETRPKIMTMTQQNYKGKTLVHGVNEKVENSTFGKIAKESNSVRVGNIVGQEVGNYMNRTSGDDTGGAATGMAIQTGMVVVKGYVSADKLYQQGIVTAIRAVNEAKPLVNDVVVGTRKIATGTKQFIRNPRLQTAKIKTAAVERLKTSKPVRATLKTARYIKKSYNNFKIVGGAITGKTTINFSGENIKKYVNANAQKAIKNVAQKTRKGISYIPNAAKKVGKTARTAAGSGIKTTSLVTRGIGNSLAQSDDVGLQATGTGLKTAYYGAVGVQTGVRAIKTGYQGAKRSINGAKTSAHYIDKGYGFLKDNNAKKKAQSAASSVGKAAYNSVKAIVSKVAHVLVSHGSAPIIIIAACMLGIGGIIGTITAIIGALFGETTTVIRELIDGGTERATISEEDYLLEHITALRNVIVEDLMYECDDLLLDNGGEYHYIHFYNGFTDVETELNADNVDRTLYSVEQYYELIQPIFHSLLLSEYQLRPTEYDMEVTFSEIATEISEIEIVTLSDEYCTDTCPTCGERHTSFCAIYEHNQGYTDNCPEHEYINHGDDNYTCSICCSSYYVCKGHSSSYVSCGQSAHSHSISIDQAKSIFFQYINDMSVGSTQGNWRLDGKMFSEDGSTVTIWVSCAYGGGTLCGGHWHRDWNSADDNGCYTTYYHDETGALKNVNNRAELDYDCGNIEKHSHCAGYMRCNGHTSAKVSLSCDSWDDLIDSFFDDEIDELEAAKTSNPSDFTSDQQIRLSQLRSYRSVVVACVEVIKKRYGGSDEIVPLPNVTLNNIANYAVSKIGKPYRHGGDDIDTGSDALGFVRAVYAHFNCELPKSFRGLAVGYTLYDYENVQCGDIVLFANNVSEDSDAERSVYHAGIYIGDGIMVHASNPSDYPRGGIKLSRIYSRGVYKVIRPLE